MEEKRKTGRSLCSDLVTLEWIDLSGSPHQSSALLEDISPRGACLQVDRPVPIALEATIRHGQNWDISCHTAYCVFREIGYFVGVVFDPGTSWNQSDYQPGHLLDLAELATEQSSVQ